MWKYIFCPELEHEIDSFKKETVKVQEIKKRLKTDKEKLSQVGFEDLLKWPDSLCRSCRTSRG